MTRKYSPTVRLSIATTSVIAGQSCTVNLSISDANGNLASGTLDWGDGTVVAWGAQAPLTQTHIYRQAGSYTILATEKDTTNMRGSATASITVMPPTPLPIPPVIPIPIPPIPTPPPAGVVAATDFSYLGCFRMPVETFNTVGDLTYSYAAMTGRVVNGHVRLLMTGSNVITPAIGNVQDAVFEMQDPEIYTLDPAAAPRASWVQAWGDVYQNKRVTFAADGTPQPLQYMLTPWLHFKDGHLYWLYYDSYNVTGRDDPSMGLTDLGADPTAMQAYGPWRAQTGGGPGCKHASGWMVEMSDGTLSVGAPRESGPYSSWGPELVGSRAWPTPATPGGFGSPNLVFPNIYVQYKQMLGYLNLDGSLPAGQPIWALRRSGDYVFHNVNPSVGTPQPPTEVDPTKNGGQGSWTQYDGVHGAIRIQTPTTRGLLFYGSVGTAHVWYGPPDNCGHGFANPCGGGQGQNSSATKAQWWIYDLTTLTDATVGTRLPYTVDPAVTVDPQALLPVTLGCKHQWGGAYYNPTTQRLYLAAYQADTTIPGLLWPLVHVFHVNG